LAPAPEVPLPLRVPQALASSLSPGMVLGGAGDMPEHLPGRTIIRVHYPTPPGSSAGMPRRGRLPRVIVPSAPSGSGNARH
jgi:hypothetical protein